MLVLVVVVGCADDPLQPLPEQFPAVPAHLPTMPCPVDNPITSEKVDLGRHLFFDKRLSSQGTIACASCHRPEKSFSDAPNQVSEGVYGARGQRNAPMIVNAGYRLIMFWDGRATTLEEQAMGAFLNSEEMDADTMAVARLLRSDEYRSKWVSAFGDTLVTMTRAMQAIGTFERTIVSANSRYDRYLRGERNVLTTAEIHGMQLFFSSKTMCSACHGGPDFTDDQFHNVGLFDHYLDRGRYNVTKDPLDEGKFKTPTLRNVALSTPYMATGDKEGMLLLRLEDVVDHYNDGGTSFPTKDSRVKKLNLTDSEKAALVAFMKALTDSSVLTNPAWQEP